MDANEIDPSDPLLATSGTLRVLGHTNRSSLHHLRHREEHPFPQPCLYVRGRARWRLSVIRKWIAEEAARGPRSTAHMTAPQRASIEARKAAAKQATKPELPPLPPER